MPEKVWPRGDCHHEKEMPNYPTPDRLDLNTLSISPVSRWHHFSRTINVTLLILEIAPNHIVNQLQGMIKLVEQDGGGVWEDEQRILERGGGRGERRGVGWGVDMPPDARRQMPNTAGANIYLRDLCRVSFYIFISMYENT